MMIEPLVSVIINCFNGEKFAVEAIQSVLNQTYQNWEIIFWDNASIDKSVEVCKKFHDPRIKCFESKHHVLLYEARNLAIAKANGEFIAFLDVDDVWLPNKLSLQIPLFFDKEVGCVYGNYFISNESRGHHWIAHSSLPSGFITDALLKKYSVGILTLIIRRSLVLRGEPLFNSSYHIIGDFDAVLRYSTKAQIVPIQKPVAIYRIHGSNEFSKSRALYLKEMEAWLESINHFPEIKLSRNLQYLKFSIEYVKAMYYLLSGNRIMAIKIGSNINNWKYRYRIYISIFLPNKLIRYLKNN